MKLLLIVALSMTLAGCPGVGGSRLCGSFDLPLADDWSTVMAVGETATYRDASGENLTLTLLAREDNEPYNLYSRDADNDADVVCDKTSLRRYTFGDGSGEFSILFVQFETLGQPFDTQELTIRATPGILEASSLSYLFNIEARDPIDFYGIDPGGATAQTYTTRVLTDFNIGEARYSIGVEDFYSDRELVRDLVPEGVLPISGVVFAKGAGLVRFDTADGQRFERVGPARP